MYFFVFRYLQTGGVETLTLRESKWFKNNKGDVCIITQVITDEMRQLYNDTGAKVVVLDAWNAKSIYSVITSFEKNVELIQFYDLRDFLQYKISYTKATFKAIYYCVHPTSDCFFKNNSILRALFQKTIAKLLLDFNKDNCVIYMDDDTLSNNLDFYGIIDKKNSFKILPLPYNTENTTVHKRNSGIFCILTVTRADFPYKGYVLGMLEDFDENHDKLPNFELTIISNGNDINLLRQKIDSLKNIKDNVILIEGVSPNKLPYYYSNSDLYIGMGTTVLEAADYSVPIIMTAYNTNYFTSTGLFHDNPMDLGSCNYSEKGIDKTIYVSRLSDEQYADIQRKTRGSLVDNYDENVILEKLDEIKCNNKAKVSFIAKTKLKLYFILHSKFFGD